MGAGTNNGGGARWGTMPRAACPVCGLHRPVGVTQVARDGGRCINRRKCEQRRAIREQKRKDGDDDAN